MTQAREGLVRGASVLARVRRDPARVHRARLTNTSTITLTLVDVEEFEAGHCPGDRAFARRL
jgi:hypothetical protein